MDKIVIKGSFDFEVNGDKIVISGENLCIEKNRVCNEKIQSNSSWISNSGEAKYIPMCYTTASVVCPCGDLRSYDW